MNRIILPARLCLPFHFPILTPPLLTSPYLPSPLLSYPTLLLYTVVLSMVVVVLLRCKVRARACSSTQSRSSTPPLWSKAHILLATLLTLTPMVYGACNVNKCTPTPCTLTNGLLTVPNTVIAIDSGKLVVVCLYILLYYVYVCCFVLRITWVSYYIIIPVARI